MNTITVKCNNCDNEFDIDLSEYDLEWEIVETHEKQMGPERNHEASIQGVECDGCDNTIDVSINVWEYPIGQFEEPIITIDGGEPICNDDLSDLVPNDCDGCDE